LRVIAGYLGGRQFKSPHGHATHPMSDKMRGAIFNVLGDIKGLSVLDTFAGTGALSFEAISRGASSALAIENDKKAQEAILLNTKFLQLENTFKLIRASLSTWLATEPNDTFDLIFCDPPYDNMNQPAIKLLPRLLKKDGLFILSCPSKFDERAFDFGSLRLISKHNYTDSQLIFFTCN